MVKGVILSDKVCNDCILVTKKNIFELENQWGREAVNGGAVLGGGGGVSDCGIMGELATIGCFQLLYGYDLSLKWEEAEE